MHFTIIQTKLRGNDYNAQTLNTFFYKHSPFLRISAEFDSRLPEKTPIDE